MENSILFTTSIVPVFYNGEVIVGNLIFYLLEKKIKSFREQLQHSRKNNDIIIEYYMNGKSGN